MLQLDLEGLKFEFQIEDYHPSTRENWDYEWCMIYAKVCTQSPSINYEVHSECMLCCEVEWLYEKLSELMDGSMTETTEISNIEPDFEYKLSSGNNNTYCMEWKFNLWNGGVLTSNSILTTLDSGNIKKLHKYLEMVLVG